MNEKLKEIQAAIDSGMKVLEGIKASATAEKRSMTDEEKKTFQDTMAQVEVLLVDRETESRWADLAERMKAPAGSHFQAGTTFQGDPGGSLPPKGKRFDDLGTFLQAVARAADPAIGNRYDSRLVYRAAGLSEGVPSDGGFLVQTDFSSTLVKRAYETGQVAGRCTRIPLSAGSNGIKLNAIDETSRANGSRWGGIQAYWLAEAGDKDAKKSKPKFRQMDLSLKKLIGLCYATDELLADASALAAVITQGFGEEFGFKLDDSIINGTGAGMPMGILNSGAFVSVAKEGSQAADTFKVENVAKMWSRMYAPSRLNAVWFINQDVEPQLNLMTLTGGTASVPVYLPPGGLSASPYASLYGRPVIPIEQCGTVGDQGDVILANMAEYLLVDKGGMQSDVSIHVRFIYDESTFRFVYRVDGQPVWAAPLTPYKGSNTLAPFVVLDARA